MIAFAFSYFNVNKKQKSQNKNPMLDYSEIAQKLALLDAPAYAEVVQLIEKRYQEQQAMEQNGEQEQISLAKLYMEYESKRAQINLLAAQTQTDPEQALRNLLDSYTDRQKLYLVLRSRSEYAKQQPETKKEAQQFFQELRSQYQYESQA